MKFKFIGNACGIFIGSEGTKLLCDPWINDGVFEGSWCHYPPLTTCLNDLLDVDAIYLSHIHPDHYDQRFFDFPSNTPIFVLDKKPNVLLRSLLKKGYSNVIPLKDNVSFTYREFTITIFAPFTNNVFFESGLDNILDSAIVLQNNNCTVFNTVDNLPNIETCKTIVENYGQVDLSMIYHNAAGPYPACFDNLSEDEKHSESVKIIQRNFEYLRALTEVLNPRFILPFAGSYVIGGKYYKKNSYLGTTTWDHCIDYLNSTLSNKTIPICLRENDVFDIVQGTTNNKYVPIDETHKTKYINNKLRHMIYDYENDNYPNVSQLEEDVLLAAKRMKLRLAGLTPNMSVRITLLIEQKKVKIFESDQAVVDLDCSLDLRLLRRILDRKANWNNASIGCHITYWRTPNVFQPDAHSALQLFYL